MTTATRQRLFFALWPDPATRAALTRLRDGVGGKLTRPDKLHLTLAFLGQQDGAAVPALRRLLDSVPARALPLQFDTYGHFSGPRIAWAGMRAAPAALVALHQALMEQLTAQGLLGPERGGFRPHVTLARNAPPPPTAAFAPLRWLADEMALVESSTATGRYTVLATRRLA